MANANCSGGIPQNSMPGTSPHPLPQSERHSCETSGNKDWSHQRTVGMLPQRPASTATDDQAKQTTPRMTKCVTFILTRMLFLLGEGCLAANVLNSSEDLEACARFAATTANTDLFLGHDLATNTVDTHMLACSLPKQRRAPAKLTPPKPAISVTAIVYSQTPSFK